jgi:hypothetical protein
MSEWQPIETAPKDGSPMLLWLPRPLAAWGDAEGGVGPLERSNVVIGWYDVGSAPSERSFEVGVVEPGWPDTEGHYSCFPIRVAPTHWMPLPDAPVVAKDKLEAQ